MTTSREITAVMRRLAPRPVRLATRANGTDFRVFIPRATAGYMSLGTERGNTWLTDYLSRYLGEPVHVVAVKFSMAGDRNAMITVRPGVCPGPGWPAG